METFSLHGRTAKNPVPQNLLIAEKIPQQKWEEAKVWLMKCIDAKSLPGESSENPRKSLAVFQMGFIEAQQGNHEEALRLYQVYLDSKPSDQEWVQVRSSYVLRKGTSEIQSGRIQEGVATIQQLFDNRDKWNVKQAFLMQGIFEVGMGWIGEANSP